MGKYVRTKKYNPWTGKNFDRQQLLGHGQKQNKWNGEKQNSATFLNPSTKQKQNKWNGEKQNSEPAFLNPSAKQNFSAFSHHTHLPNKTSMHFLITAKQNPLF